jgi:hypothetical protein
MSNKQFVHTKLSEGILKIGDKEIFFPEKSLRPIEKYDIEGMTIVIFDIAHAGAPWSNSNVIAYNSKGNTLWRVEPIFSETAGPAAYFRLIFDAALNGYYLYAFSGEWVRLDITTGKITREGRNYPR